MENIFFLGPETVSRVLKVLKFFYAEIIIALQKVEKTDESHARSSSFPQRLLLNRIIVQYQYQEFAIIPNVLCSSMSFDYT